MSVVGIGTDIIECVRIAKVIQDHGELFLGRVYTRREIAYCQSHRSSLERFSGRWAAKEAILKALGTGWQKGISWKDMEIQNHPKGAPVVALGGAARARACELRLDRILISISHCKTHATAFAIALAAASTEDPCQGIPEVPSEEAE